MKNSYSFADNVWSLPMYKAFDPYEDFCQFLEEAKQHAQEASSQPLVSEKEKLAADKIPVKDKKSNKSWKASTIISWLKLSKPRAQPSSTLAAIKQKKVSASGPVCSSEGRDYVKPKRQLSGQLNGLFTPLRKADTKMQYISLAKLDTNRSLQSNVPIYTVR
ncbi:unnamed protein product [Rhodiola kirilowii]